MLRVPNLDVDFVRRWSPARFAALGLAIYGILLLTSPLEYDFDKFSWQAIAYAAGCQLAFFGGCYVVNGLDRRGMSVTVQPLSMPADRMINLTLALGLVGVLSRFYDRVIARGFTVTENLLENRETISENLTSFAYIGGLFFSFGLIAITLMWLTGAHRRRPYAFVLASVLALYPMFETIVQGSRSTMIHTLVLLFLCARSANAMRWLVRSKLALLLCGVAVLLFAEAIYQMRTFASGVEAQDMVDIFMLTAISDYARPSQWVVDVLVSTNGVGLLGGAVKTWTHVSQYLTHSWLAYCDNYKAFEGILGYGRYHLFLLMRFLSVLAGEDLYFDPTSYGMISGVSTTGFTSLLYDFGAGGPLVAAIFGFVATTIQRWTIQIPERWLPLYMYLCFACLMHMIDNIFLGGLGAFAIWTFTGYAGFHYLVTVLAGGGSRVAPEELPVLPAEQPGLRASPQ